MLTTNEVLLHLCLNRVVSHGILVGLADLYQNLLKLLKIVAEAQPMPYLADVSLPADMAEFLGPSDAKLLTKRRLFGSRVKKPEMKQQPQKTADVKGMNQEGKVETEDLGVSVKRGTLCPEKVSYFSPCGHMYMTTWS